LVCRVSGEIEDEIYYLSTREDRTSRLDASSRHHRGRGLDLAEARQGGLT